MFFLHILILYHLLEEVIFTLYYLYTTTNKSISLSKLEPIVYLTLAVLGEFLLFNWRIFL